MTHAIDLTRRILKPPYEPTSQMNPLIEHFVRQYKPKVSLYAKLATFVAERCRTALSGHALPATVTCRAKQPDRLAAKLTKRNEHRHYAVEADMGIDAMDLAGVRIALHFPHQEEEVFLLLEKLFVVRDVKIHGDIHAPSIVAKNGVRREVVFENRPSGYRAIHVHVQLGPTVSPGDSGFGSFLCEVQITSFAMHVWSEVEHALVYKAMHGRLSGNEVRLLKDLRECVRTAEDLLHRLRVSTAARVRNERLLATKAKL